MEGINPRDYDIMSSINAALRDNSPSFQAEQATYNAAYETRSNSELQRWQGELEERLGKLQKGEYHAVRLIDISPNDLGRNNGIMVPPAKVLVANDLAKTYDFRVPPPDEGEDFYRYFQTDQPTVPVGLDLDNNILFIYKATSQLEVSLSQSTKKFLAHHAGSALVSPTKEGQFPYMTYWHDIIGIRLDKGKKRMQKHGPGERISTNVIDHAFKVASRYIEWRLGQP